MSSRLVDPDEIRVRFAQAMSDSIQTEAPRYRAMLNVVAKVNTQVLHSRWEPHATCPSKADVHRLNPERHGAICLATAAELATARRLFAVMGMFPVGYYNLAEAGVPVHSTAFRPISAASLEKSPLRLFTSLVRLDLIEDAAFRVELAAILARRRIFSTRLLQLIDRHENEGGLTPQEAIDFVGEALKAFRWHTHAAVDLETYRKICASDRLIADVVAFGGPSVNYLAAHTLDIDAAQDELHLRGLNPYGVMEGPARRHIPILLRQTSFTALKEPIAFSGNGARDDSHRVSFGAIEQRGIALTRRGRALYDQLLVKVPRAIPREEYEQQLSEVFHVIPDDIADLRRFGLGFFRYEVADIDESEWDFDRVITDIESLSMDVLVDVGIVKSKPILYEDFLPFSAAGVLQHSLGYASRLRVLSTDAKTQFEADLGSEVHDEIKLYEAIEQRSIQLVRDALRTMRLR